MYTLSDVLFNIQQLDFKTTLEENQAEGGFETVPVPMYVACMGFFHSLFFGVNYSCNIVD